MSDRLILPGQPGPPLPERVQVNHSETVVGPDGQLYAMQVTGEADLVRGPLGRFIDLADQITREGLTVPSRIAEAIQAECATSRSAT